MKNVCKKTCCVCGNLRRALRKEKCKMKKSTMVTLLALLAALAGALGAGYLYLLKRERELDEYEEMLFSEDFSHECEDGCDCTACDEDDSQEDLTF